MMLRRQLVSKSGGSTSNNNKVRKSHIPWSAGQLSTSEAVGSQAATKSEVSVKRVGSTSGRRIVGRLAKQ